MSISRSMFCFAEASGNRSAPLCPPSPNTRCRCLFATEDKRHGRPSAPAAGAPRQPGAMFASVVRTMMGVSAEPRKFRCARYASLAGRVSRVGHIERFSDTSSETHRLVPVRRRDRPPSAPHPPDPFRRPLAGSTSPSATSPGSPPAWTPPCSRWYAHADGSRDDRSSRQSPPFPQFHPTPPHTLPRRARPRSPPPSRRLRRRRRRTPSSAPSRRSGRCSRRCPCRRGAAAGARTRRARPEAASSSSETASHAMLHRLATPEPRA